MARRIQNLLICWTVVLAAGLRPVPAPAGPADGVWSELPPPHRSHHAAIIDPVLRRMLVYGGELEQESWRPRGDVWWTPLDGPPSWHLLRVTGETPGARAGSAAVYDPVQRRMIVFGGYDGTDAGFEAGSSDVWALSLDGTPAWTRLLPTGAPPSPRMGHSMTYDPARRRVIVFGGEADFVRPCNDVWQLSLGDSLAWTELHPAGVLPAARATPAATLDPTGDQLVIFGGMAEYYSRLGDTWTLDLDGPPAWTEITARLSGQAPAGRESPMAITQASRSRMLVFGGRTYPSGLPDTLWALSFADSAWTGFPAEGTRPTGRALGAFLLDSLTGSAVLFGGNSPWPDPVDLWRLSLGDTPEWTPGAGAARVRWPGLVVLDSRRERFIWYLGPEVWTKALDDPDGWERIDVAGTVPPEREGGSAIYDPVRDRLVVFGGCVYRGPCSSETWALSLSGTPAWALLAADSTGPAPSLSSEAVYDPPRDRLVVFSAKDSSYVFRNQTWALPLSDPAVWRRLAPDWDWRPPRSRQQASLAFDSLRDRLLLFGGFQGGGGVTEDFADVWSLALGDTAGWVQLQPLGVTERALRRHGAPMAYDAARDRMVVIGGGYGNYLESSLVDAWALELGEPLRWVQIFPEGGNTPAWVRTTAHPDPGRDRILLGQRGSLWALDWTQPLPADIVLESADAGASGVLVRWRVTGPTDFVAILERASGGDGWKGVTSLRPDSAGRIRWREPAPAPGSRLGFRLRVSGGGSSRLYGSTWLGAPAHGALVIEGVRPNPGPGEFAVAFTLPEATATRLELFDLGGRCVHSEELADLGAGSHVLPLQAGQRMRPGLYWLRIVQGGRAATTKVVIAR